jgi:hypothetical protein
MAFAGRGRVAVSNEIVTLNWGSVTRLRIWATIAPPARPMALLAAQRNSGGAGGGPSHDGTTATR